MSEGGFVSREVPSQWWDEQASKSVGPIALGAAPRLRG